MKAYTIGNEKSYDRALADKENTAYKIGRQLDSDPPYEGGCLWKTPEEATAFIETEGEHLGFTAAVYEVLLPTGWDEDVSAERSTSGPFHHLLHDALIVRKMPL